MQEIPTDDLLKKLIETDDIEDFLDGHNADQINYSLSEYLSCLLTEKRLNKKEVIAKAELDSIYGYQIFNGTKSSPSKDKIVQLAIGMGLNLNETQKLLRVAHLPQLYVKDKRDSILIFIIEHHMNIFDANQLLYGRGLKVF